MSKLEIRFQIIMLKRKFLMKVTFQFVTRIFKKKKEEENYIYNLQHHQRVRSFDLFIWLFISQLK